MTSEQLSEWEAYDKLEPIGDWRGDYQAALICAVVTNLAQAAYGGKRREPINVMDFMPDWAKEIKRTEALPKQSVEEMKSIMKAIASVANKGDKKIRGKSR